MKPERLLQHFEQVAEAPEAVPRLRRSILDLAVRGKLVEQDLEDEPASELLTRIEEEKGNLTQRRMSAPIDLPPIVSDEVPFEMPRGWLWLRFGSLHDLVRGVTYSKSDVSEQGSPDHLPILRANNIGSSLSFDDLVFVRKERIGPDQFLRQGDYMIALSSGSKNLVGKAAYVEEDFTGGFGGFCGVIRLNSPVLRPFVGIFLSSRLYRDALSEGSRGIGINNLKRETLSNALFPLPPLAEQHRIVAKVDELMALCDELEAAQAKRERRRDRLVAATLHGLNNGDAGAEPGTRSTFEDSARFYFNHLPRLTARPEHIHQLRESILNLAVRGRLVEQDPTDEPASMVLVDVAKGRERVMDVLGLRQQPALPEVRYVAAPFGAPDSWVWSLVDDCFVVTGGIQKTPKRTPRNNAFPYVGVANVYRGRLDLSEVKKFELNEGELERLHLEANDLLIVEGNGSASEIGRCARWSDELSDCVHQNHIIRCRPGNPGISRFAELYLNSGFGVGVMRELAVTSAGLYNLSVGKIRKIQLPLPPLAEQHRIVAKVDELMALCDELESRLITTATTRRQLLEATLAEALEGVLEHCGRGGGG